MKQSKRGNDLPYESVLDKWQETTRGYKEAILYALNIQSREQWTKTPYLAEFQVFSCGHFSQAWGHQWAREGLDEGILIYCTDGKGYYHQGGKSWNISSGDLLYCFPNTTHHYIADSKDPWSIYWMHIRGERTAVYSRHIGVTLNSPVVAIGRQPAVISLFQSLFMRFQAVHNTTNMLAIQSCASDILGTIAVATQSKSVIQHYTSEIQSAINLMDKSLNAQLDVKRLAAEVDLSVSHFFRIFKASTALSPIQYFNQLKVQKACTLLAGSKLKIKEVAAQLGFDDQYYFSRLFKKLTGFSPEKYRQMAS